MLTTLLLATTSIALNTIDPCPDTRAPDMPIQYVVSAPLDIAVALHLPVGRTGTLTPPLEAFAAVCTEDGVVNPRPIVAGDRILAGALTNAGSTTITIITAHGSVLRLGPAESVWVGSTRDLEPTHDCVCECTCAAGDATGTIRFWCHGDGGCPHDDAVRCMIEDGRKMAQGSVRDCSPVYVPRPPEKAWTP